MKTEHALPGRAKPRAREFDRPAYANVLDRLEKSGRSDGAMASLTLRAARQGPGRKQPGSFMDSEGLCRICRYHGASHRPPRGGIRPQDPISHLGSSLAYIPPSSLDHHCPANMGEATLSPCQSTLRHCHRAPPVGWPCGHRLQISLPYLKLILFERKTAVHTGTVPSFRPLYRTWVQPVLPGSLRTIIPLAPAPAFVPFD
jgi:hypothetical protein